MKSLRNLLIIAAAVLMPVLAAAQMADQVEVRELNEKYQQGLSKAPAISLFDLSRLNISHSYSLTFFSMGGNSGSRGFFNSTIQYKLANPLTLTLDIGVMHDPGALWGDRTSTRNAEFYPAGRLDWKPSDNFNLSVEFARVPVYYYGGYDYNYGRGYFWRP